MTTISEEILTQINETIDFIWPFFPINDTQKYGDFSYKNLWVSVDNILINDIWRDRVIIKQTEGPACQSNGIGKIVKKIIIDTEIHDTNGEYESLLI